MATLRDLDLQPFETLSDTGRVREPPVLTPGDRWLVLIGESGPVSAIAPGTSLANGERPPAILVAAADLDLTVLHEAAVFQAFGAEVSALVVTEPGPVRPGATGIAGVVSGREITRLLLRGGLRGSSGPVLPGAPAIPLIARSCGYLETEVACATPLSFPARPSPLPDCPNQRALTAHRFVW